MWYPIWKWFKENNIEFDGLDASMFKNDLPHSFEEFKEIVDSWGMSRTPRPYQYEAAYKVLQYKISLSELATRAGKTLISYMIFRYSMTYLGVKKILMIVPGIDLVKQGFEDFKEYAEFFNAECIWSGGKVVESSNMTIATFQSLVNFLDKKNKKYNPDFFNDYDCVFVDETHRANSNSIKSIISQPFMKKCKLSFGMTGTLPKPFTIDSYCLHSLLGAKIQTITADDLIQQGYISPVHIYQHQIHYSNKIKQLKTWCRCAEYSLSNFIEVSTPTTKNPKKKSKVQLENPEFLIAYKKEFPVAFEEAKLSIFKTGDTEENWLKYKKLLETAVTSSTKANKLHVEVMSVHFFEERINYLIDVLEECPNNTLVLAQHTEYIKHVVERLREAFPDRPVIAVYGASKERKTAKTVFKENNNAIMVANYAIMGTGITLNNLCYGVLFESFKSDSLNRQSIGRGLGLSEMKDTYILHDFTDTFDKKYSTQKIVSQGKQRIKIYEEQKFPYEIVKVTI
jgi:superfamily II DNA or RNA helicase